MLYGRHDAPAELPKSAGSFDLPIAVGILAGSGQIKSDLLDQYAIVGELALDGSTRPVKGALSIAMAAASRAGCARQDRNAHESDRGKISHVESFYDAETTLDAIRAAQQVAIRGNMAEKGNVLGRS